MLLICQQGIGEIFVGLGLVVGPAVGGLLYGVSIIKHVKTTIQNGHRRKTFTHDKGIPKSSRSVKDIRTFCSFQKLLNIFKNCFYFFSKYTERKKKRRVNFIPKFHSRLKKFVKYFTTITKRYTYGTIVPISLVYDQQVSSY